MSNIWFPNQRVIRTAVQVVLAVASGIGVFLLVAPEVLEAIREFLPESWYLWLIGFIAFVGAVSAALSRIMAIPQVDGFLKKFGAGSEPAETHVVLTEEDGLQGLTRREYKKFLEK